MNKERIPTRELTILTEEILKNYKRASFDYRNLRGNDIKYYIRLKDDKVFDLSAKEYSLAIESILDNINPEEREILIELFIKRTKNQVWYLDKYSKATFYRAKRRALEDFIFYFMN